MDRWSQQRNRNIYAVKCMLSTIWLSATSCTVAHQAPLSMGFFRQKYWSGLPFPPPGDLPNPGTKPTSPTTLALAGRFFTMWANLEDQKFNIYIHTHTYKWKLKWQSCPTLCDPMDYTVHGILQARILEWVAYPFSSRYSRFRNQTRVSCIAGRFFTNWAMREAYTYIYIIYAHTYTYPSTHIYILSIFK